MNNELVKMSFRKEKTKVTKSAVAVILDCAIVIPISDLDVQSAYFLRLHRLSSPYLLETSLH